MHVFIQPGGGLDILHKNSEFNPILLYNIISEGEHIKPRNMDLNFFILNPQLTIVGT